MFNLHLYTIKNQPNVGKYTSPMDAMGAGTHNSSTWLQEAIEAETRASFFGNRERSHGTHQRGSLDHHRLKSTFGMEYVRF